MHRISWPNHLYTNVFVLCAYQKKLFHPPFTERMRCVFKCYTRRCKKRLCLQFMLLDMFRCVVSCCVCVCGSNEIYMNQSTNELENNCGLRVENAYTALYYSIEVHTDTHMDANARTILPKRSENILRVCDATND